MNFIRVKYFFVFLFLTFIFQPLIAGELEVTFIDVGYGDAIFISTPSQKKILIDGGGPEGGRSVVQFLNRNNVTSIDFMISTHAHPDHVSGLTYVLKDIKVINVIENGIDYKSPVDEEYDLFLQFKKLSRNETDQFYILKKGEGLKLKTEEIEFHVYHPNVDSPHLNDDSLITYLRYGKISFLFAADIDERGRTVIAENRFFPPVSVLKSPHHGDYVPADNFFLDYYKPDMAVISVGQNEQGRPDTECLDLYKRKEIKIFRTDVHGTIKIISDGEHYWTFLKNGQQYPNQ